METNTQNEMPNDIPVHQPNAEVSAQLHTNAEGIVIDPNDPAHPDHPEHHKHMSALVAAGLTHSAVNHVLPHHRGIDL